MMKAARPLANMFTRLRADEIGSTAIETAIVLPVFMMLVLGTFDLGYLMYNRAMLNGLVAKAARDSTIETNIGDAADNIDQQVRDMLLIGASQANVSFTRQNFADFASANQSEPYSDANSNKRCDNGEAFEDQNGNGIWDSGAVSGQGGAKDVVVYQVDLSYPRLIPLQGLLGFSDNVDISARTVIQNQPYAQQQQRVTKVGYCS